MTRTSVPKYSIRVSLIWLIPFLSLFVGCGAFLPFLLAAVLTPFEIPKVRQKLFGKRGKQQLICLRVPALMRLCVLWLLQIWWLFLWRAESSIMEDSASLGDISATDGDSSVGSDGGGSLIGDDSFAWSPQTFSIVLPCAGEGEYAFKTVKSVFETTPGDSLREIIVVDDGSTPALGDTVLTEDVRSKYRVKIIRHEETVGLIGAKKDGGDAAIGDIVVFFDCHVAPQSGWHSSFLQLIGKNYRRIVVPVITDLDVTTWRQRGGNGGQAKCYLTWDADFKWFESDDPYVPVVSGGLLGISKRWWNETGGYDDQMIGWGGENLDQSLRSWLCGGEIMIAKDAFVAHMWRVPSDPRTKAKYVVKAGAANRNRMRAVVAWFGDFSEKLGQFPMFDPNRKDADGNPWYGDLENILEVKRRLECRSYAWFINRFKHVYEDGGLVPQETFGLKALGNDKCLTYLGNAGTSPDGHGKAKLMPCDMQDDRQRWHGANRDLAAANQPCCSGMRAWNTDQCILEAAGGAVTTFVCDISGNNKGQFWDIAEGQLRKRSADFLKSQCFLPDGKTDKIKVKNCPGSGSAPVWSKERPSEPIESQLYRKALAVGEV